MSVGNSFGCALLSGGGIQCWGTNSSGQLGNNSTATASTPVPVSGISSGVVQIVTGQSHACALMSNGTVQCWGSNSYGQISPGNAQQFLTPTTVAGISSATQIAAGAEHTCALLSSGQIECWGGNPYGQIGVGDLTTVRSKATTNSFFSSGVTSATIGGSMGYHVCAIQNGGALSWGSNSNGQLGNGTTTDSAFPVPVSGMTSGVTAVSAGDSHTCAVQAGTVNCWGANFSGQLGDGTTTQRNSSVPVSGLSGSVTQLSAGSSFTCALLGLGGVQCWGYNYDGELGNGTTNSSATTSPVNVSGLNGVTQIVSGSSHTCALLNTGQVQCWGYNYNGQLGNNSTLNSSVPVTVSGLSGVVRITAGSAHTCALLTNGSIQCWGSNYSGELGNGSTSQSNVPVAVAGLASGKLAVDLTGGGSHTCALFQDGSVQCWGSDTSGQIGDATVDSNPRLAPVSVPGLASGVLNIVASQANTCAVTTSGNLLCWGDNTNNQADSFSTTTPRLVCGP